MHAAAAMFVKEHDRDMPLLALPRPETQIIVRFGPTARGGLDVHAFGTHSLVRRKVIRGVHRTVTARLPLGAPEAVLGVRASALAGRIVALDELWGADAAQQLCARLATARTSFDAAETVERAVAERLAIASCRPVHPHTRLALVAADRLRHTSVNEVAAELGISARHLRRLFHDVIGVSPKAFARLARFHRALRAGRADPNASWARIATATGYYDQSHLIDEFRTIAGATPHALLGEIALAATITREDFDAPPFVGQVASITSRVAARR